MIPRLAEKSNNENKKGNKPNLRPKEQYRRSMIQRVVSLRKSAKQIPLLAKIVKTGERRYEAREAEMKKGNTAIDT